MDYGEEQQAWDSISVSLGAPPHYMGVDKRQERETKLAQIGSQLPL